MSSVTPHSLASPAARHALHAFEWADNTARDGHTYVADDRGKLVLVLSPLKFFLITSVSGGVASFLELGASAVSSVFTRTGAIAAAAGDYNASKIDNDSGVSGTHVKDALDTLASAIVSLAGSSVPTSRLVSAGTGLTGGGSLSADRSFAVAYGTSGTTACAGNDARLSDTRTPTAHESSHLPSGSDPLSTGAPSTLVVGGSNAAGTANALARQDHVHALPAFGTGAGTFCQGNDSRLVGVAKLATVWFADIPPSSPSSYDDECNGNSGAAIDGKWTDWAGSGATLAHTYNGRGQMELTQTTHAGQVVQGIRQAIPNSEFAFAASVGGTIQGGNFTMAGIFVAGDIATNPTTAAFLFHGQQWGPTNTGRVFVLQKSSNYTTFVGNFGASATGPSVPRYYRMRVNGTTVSSDVSEDGKSWWQIDSQTATFTPAFFGIAINNNNTGVTQIAVIDWFRVLGTGASSSGINATWAGGYPA